MKYEAGVDRLFANIGLNGGYIELKLAEYVIKSVGAGWHAYGELDGLAPANSGKPMARGLLANRAKYCVLVRKRTNSS